MPSCAKTMLSEQNLENFRSEAYDENTWYSMMNGLYEDAFRLRISDYNTYDQLTPQAILDLFQDVAGKHADLIGVGFHDLIQNDRIWVLVRTKFDVLQYPKLYDTVAVSTWPKKKGRIDFDREYEIRDSSGQLLVCGISKWVVVNAKTRRICSARDIEYRCELIDKENYPQAFPKIDDFSVEGLPFLEQMTSFSDLDHNGHVNNINYARYILNAIPLSPKERIRSFEIDYLKELTLNFKIKVYYKRDAGFLYCKGTDETGATSFVSKIGLETEETNGAVAHLGERFVRNE